MLDKEMGVFETIGVCAIVVILFLMAFIFIPPVPAKAEEIDVISVYEFDVWDVEIGGEKLEEIQFEYDGQILAMYWDTIPEGPLWARIWAGIEAIDAGEILPLRLNQPVLAQR